MKKIFTLIILCTLFLGANAQKKVLYLGHNKTTMSSTTGSDTLLLWLKSQPTVFTVDTTIDITNCHSTYAAAVAAKSTNGANDYDLVIMDDMLDGTKCATLTPAVLTKPVVMIKTYAFTKGRLNMGTPADILSGQLYISVPDGKQTSAIFTGITIPSNNRIVIFNSLATDLGVSTSGTKGVSVINDTTFAVTPASGLEVFGRDTLSKLTGMSLFKLQANTNMGYMATKTSTPLAGQTYTVPLIVVGFNGGALWLRKNITTDGLRILQNAVYIQAGLDPAEINKITATPQSKVSKLAVLRSGNQFQIQFGKSQKTEVSVYSATGVLVSKKLVNADNTTIDLTGKAKGVYIIKAAGLTQKVVVE
jgi:hypothetical protein